MKLPISTKQTNTGAIELTDAEGNKVGTIRTSVINGSGAINKANAEFIVAACAAYESQLQALATASGWIESGDRITKDDDGDTITATDWKDACEQDGALPA